MPLVILVLVLRGVNVNNPIGDTDIEKTRSTINAINEHNLTVFRPFSNYLAAELIFLASPSSSVPTQSAKVSRTDSWLK